MRLRCLVAMSVLVAAPGMVQAQGNPPDNSPIVQVGVFSTQPDGSVASYAVETGERQDEQFASGVLADSCRLGAGQGYIEGKMPAWGADAWHLQGRVLSMSAEQAVVELSWQRVRVSGTDVQQATESRRLVLPIQQLVTLDHATPGVQCESRTVIFGARYAPRLVVDPAAGSRGGGGRAAVSGSPASFDAELWLVRSAPGLPDQVVPTRVHGTGGSAQFQFPVLTLPVEGGVLEVRIGGQLRAMGDGRTLLVRADRVASFTPQNRPPRDRDGVPERGNAVIMRPWPGANDVLELQMPPLELRAASGLPDRFAVRLRIRPAN